MNHTSRIVVLVDMDCFYCQVEEKLNPDLKGKPVAVVQYNEWRGGGIIAVNYEARAKGVTRHMRGNDAKEVCPDINLVKVPQIRGKADLNKYRNAGKEVADVLQTFTPILERASVDEAYLDITEEVENRIKEKNCKISMEKLPNSYVVGSEIAEFVDNFGSDEAYNECKLKLLVGGVIAEEIRAKVYEVTGYRCSAGIAHNKILAKLVCGLHKPNKQTLLPQDAVPVLYENLPVKKIKGFGGKFGVEISQLLKINTMAELSKFSEKELVKLFDDKIGNWLYNIARGIDSEPVIVRLISKSIGCSKNFLGKSMLVSQESVEHWLQELISELSERLQKDIEENNRRAKNMIINFSQLADSKNTVSASRTCQITSYDHNKLFEKAVEVLNKNCRKNDGTFRIIHLGFSLSNFEDIKNFRSITSFFKNMESKEKRRPMENVPENSKIVTQTKVSNLDENLSAFDQAKILETSTFSEESDSDDENASVFSTSTISDDKRFEDNVVYLETVRPETVLDQSFPIYDTCANLSTSSVDSITPEICNHVELNAENNRAPSSSFFEKFFNEKNSKREFNTSKIFEQDSDTELSNKHDETEEEMEISVKSQEKLAISNDDFSNNFPIQNSNVEKFSNKEICTECGKHILIEEITSHMDYHLAIKIVKSEAHLYQSASSTKTDVKDQKPAKKLKRKSNEKTDSVVPISKFFSKDEISLEDSKMCTECSKRIKNEDFASHLDYHAARKLHLELNSQNKSNSPVKMLNSRNKSKSPAKMKTGVKKQKVVSKEMNIVSFFKKC